VSFDPSKGEEQRLEEARSGRAAWRHWGPYLSERQWGTVREDYSENGTAWEVTIRHARAHIVGVRTASLEFVMTVNVCASRLALWNGADPILKERMFGLTGNAQRKDDY
jgi:hypothetical protein